MKKRNKKMMKFTMPVKMEQRVTIFDMKSNNTTEFKIYENNGGIAIEFRSPSAVRVCKEQL